MLSIYIKVISLSLFSFPKWVFTGHNHLDIIHFQKFYPQMLDYSNATPALNHPNLKCIQLARQKKQGSFEILLQELD